MEERKKNVKEEIWLLQGLIKIKNLLEGWIAAYYFVDIDKQVDEIDKHVDIELLKLFTSFNFSLKKNDLKQISLKGKSNEKWGLGDIQRKFTGIPKCKDILGNIRFKRNTLEEKIKTKRKLAELGLDLEFDRNEY